MKTPTFVRVSGWAHTALAGLMIFRLASLGAVEATGSAAAKRAHFDNRRIRTVSDRRIHKGKLVMGIAPCVTVSTFGGSGTESTFDATDTKR